MLHLMHIDLEGETTMGNSPEKEDLPITKKMEDGRTRASHQAAEGMKTTEGQKALQSVGGNTDMSIFPSVDQLMQPFEKNVAQEKQDRTLQPNELKDIGEFSQALKNGKYDEACAVVARYAQDPGRFRYLLRDPIHLELQREGLDKKYDLKFYEAEGHFAVDVHDKSNNKHTVLFPEGVDGLDPASPLRFLLPLMWDDHRPITDRMREHGM